MDAGFQLELREALDEFEKFYWGCLHLSKEFWAGGRVPASSQQYYAIEEVKRNLDTRLYSLKQKIKIVTGVDECGNEKSYKDREREAWINWMEFSSRSIMLGLQGLYCRFVFHHQAEIFKAASGGE